MLDLLMIGGPSGVGKTTAVDALLRDYPQRYSRPVSVTSRQRRPGEGNSEYTFCSRADILKMNECGALLTLDEVYDNYYAITKESLASLTATGSTPIKEIHPKNHQKIQRLLKHAVSIVLLPEPTHPPTRLAGASAGPEKRDVEDGDCYGQQELAFADFVLSISDSDSPSHVAQRIHRAACLHESFSGRFPHPREIDTRNQEGYQQLAPQFTEALRPTTTNFHSASFAFFSNAISSLKKGAQCLEIGPGNGWLRSVGSWPQVQYCAVDICDSMHLHAPSIRSVGSARLLPFRSGCFDAIFGSLADGYIYPAAILEMERVLKVGGTIFLSLPAHEWARGIRKDDGDITTFHLSDKTAVSVYSFALQQHLLKGLFEATGLKVLECFDVPASAIEGTIPIAAAIIQSAENQGLPVNTLPIVTVLSIGKI